jgi:hypothetical protein
MLKNILFLSRIEPESLHIVFSNEIKFGQIRVTENMLTGLRFSLLVDGGLDVSECQLNHHFFDSIRLGVIGELQQPALPVIAKIFI